MFITTLAAALLSLSTLSVTPTHATAIEARNDAPISAVCKTVSFTLTATASNRQFILNLSDPVQLSTTILSRVFTIAGPKSYTSRIVGRYCEPKTFVAGRNDQLEIYFHSITNNKNAWSGLGPPGQGYQGNNYSFVEYAAKLGYPTLALDRLGNGESDHPDPIFVAQGPYEYALYHQLIQAIKTGKGNALPRTYKDIILISNSYGSVIVDNILALYPGDVNKAILTGYTKDFIKSFPGITAVLPAPAAVALPARFGNLSPGYLTTTSVQGRRDGFFGTTPNVAYDLGISVLDEAVRDVVAVGQFVSNYLDYNTIAKDYTGRVLILTGEEDSAACGPGTGTNTAKCGQSIPGTKSLYPNADYSYYSVANTGHALYLHYSRFEIFDVAHRFIQGASFAKSG